MTTIVETDQGGARVTCAANLQVADVAALWGTLQPLLAAPPAALTVDASQVRRIDAAAVQAFAVLARDLRMAGCAVHWDACSAEWSSAVELTGMTGMLDATP
jgi:anti-anti-sigma regulatory factor